MKQRFFFSFLIALLSLGTTAIAKGGHGGGHSGGHGGSHAGHGGGFGHGGHSTHTGGHTAARSSAERHAPKGPRGGHTMPRGTHNEIPMHHIHSHRYAPYASYWLHFGTYYNPYWVRTAIPGYPDIAESDSIYGYIVYNTDTVAGKAFMYENEIAIQTTDSVDPVYTYDYTDSNLHCITLFSNGQEMYLVRLKEKGDEFWRVVHAGRLSLYDDNFSFSFTQDDVNFDDMMVMYDGKLERLGNKFSINEKKRLVDLINKAYDLNMNPRYFNKKEVLDYLQTLD